MSRIAPRIAPRFALALIPALLAALPATATAAPSTDTYEPLRAPAGKTVTMWRHVNRPQTALVTCPPDSTKAFWCHARKAEATRKLQQLSER